MRVTALTGMLVIFSGVCSTPLHSAEVLFLEAEDFDEIKGTPRNFGGIRGVVLDRKDKKNPENDSYLGTSFSVDESGAYSCWMRVYFPWRGQDGLSLVVDDNEPITLGAKGQAGRWDQGNFQVWHWVEGGQFDLKKGAHTLRINLARSAKPRVDKVVFSTDPGWGQDWLTGDLARLSAQPTAKKFDKGDALIIEAEDFDSIDGSIHPYGKGKVVRLTDNGDRAAATFEVPRPVEGELWLRLYFHAKNMFEDETMEEMANNCYLAIDGVLQMSFFEQNCRRWFWASGGDVSLSSGKHLITVEKWGEPVDVDKVVLYTGKDAMLADWFQEPQPHPLPFNLPNAVPFASAKRVSDWRLFSDLAAQTNGEFLGEESNGVRLPTKLTLPKDGGYLVLEKQRPLQSSEGLRGGRDQQTVLPLHTTASGISAYVIWQDATGELFMRELEGKVAPNKWSVLSGNVPVDAGDARVTYFDGTGGMTENAIALRIAAGEKHGTPSPIWHRGGDGVPQYPIGITHIVLRKDSTRAAEVTFGEPHFDSPFDMTASPVSEPKEGRCKVMLSVTNRASSARLAEIHWRTAEHLYDFIHDRAKRQVLSRHVMQVPAQGSAELAVDAELKSGVTAFIFAVGQGDRKRILLGDPDQVRSAMLLEEQKHGGFYFSPDGRKGTLLKEDGTPIKRTKAQSVYGDEFAVIADGLDVTSLAYADREGYASPIVPRGWNLTDEAGWPLMKIPNGVLAVDSTVGRYKFNTGDGKPLEVVGKLTTGFGVPGSGPAYVRGDYAYLPSGEGNYTIVDISDKKKPRVVSFACSWYFSHDLFPLGHLAYFNSSHRGLQVIDGLFNNPYRPGRIRSVTFNRAKYGRITHVYEGKKIAISRGGGKLSVHHLSDPFSPREIASVEGVSGFFPVEDKGIAFCYSGEEVVAIDVRTPSEPRILPGRLPRFKNKKGKLAGVFALSPENLAMRLGNEIRFYNWRIGEELSVTDAGLSMKIPEGCGRTIHAKFNGKYFYLIDGKSKYAFKKSRWFTYVLDGKEARLVSTYEDTHPTEFSRLTIEGEYAYIFDFNYGLWIFDIRDPARPVKVSGVATAGEADGLWTDGKHAYMWQTFGGTMFTMDVSNVRDPKRLGEYWDGGWVPRSYFRGKYTVASKGDAAYLPRYRGIVVIDVSDPARPKEAGLLRDENGGAVKSNAAACLHAHADRLYVFSRKNVLYIYDISAPLRPALVGHGSVPAQTFFIQSGKAYTASGTRKKPLSLFSIADISSDKPKQLSTLDLSGVAGALPIRGIVVRKGYAYLAACQRAPWTRLYVVDVSDPANPRLVRYCDPSPDLMDAPCSSSWGDSYRDMSIDGNYIFIGNYGQIECLDISDPERPKFFDRRDIGYQWSGGHKHGEYLYVPTLQGLVILAVPSSSQVPAGKVEVRANLRRR